jgi:phage tail-like protein
MWASQIPSHESVEAGGVVFGSLALLPAVQLAADAGALVSQTATGPDVVRVGLRGSVLWREQDPDGGDWEVFISVNSGAKEVVFPHKASQYSIQQPLRVDDWYVEAPGGGVTQISVGLRHATPGVDSINVILPCFVLEAIDIDEDSTGVVVENRFPYDEQVQVPWDLDTWTFALTNYDGAAPPSTLDLYVNGVLVRNLAGTNFFGVTALSSTASRTTVTVTPDGSGPFSAPNGDIEWTVRAVGTGFDEMWSFTTTNQLAPSIVRAEFISGKQVLVQFSESMEGGEDVLLTGAYDVFPNITPSYPPTVIAVEHVDINTILLTLDDNVNFRTPYTLTVASSVTDTSGHAVALTARIYILRETEHIQPTRETSFFEKAPVWNQCNDPDGEFAALARILTDAADQAYYGSDSWLSHLDCEEAPIDYVDLMLRDLGNPFKFEMTENERRALCFELSAMQEMIGTEPGIEAVVLFFTGIAMEVVTRADDPIWILGDAVRSVLGATTVVAPPPESSAWLTIWLELPPGVLITDLTDEQVLRAEIIVRTMFPDNAKYGGIIEA